MNGHHHTVLLGDHQHLFTDHDTCKGLAYVLNHLAAIDSVGDDCLTLLSVVHKLDLAALLIYFLPQIGVLQAQSVGQQDAVRPIYFENAAPTKGCGLFTDDCGEDICRRFPKLCDAWVCSSVRVDDSFRLILWYLHSKSFELRSKLSRTHTIASPKNRRLTDKPFILRNCADRFAIDSRCHDFVYVFATVKCLHQVVLSSQPCQRSCLNLR